MKKAQSNNAKTSLPKMIFGTFVVILILLIPLVEFVLYKKLVFVICYSIFVVLFILAVVIMGESAKKKALEEIFAFSENSYSAYKLTITQKMWIGSDGKSANYYDHYYIKCGELIIDAFYEEFRYAEAGNNVILVVFELQKGRTVEKLIL